MLSSMQTQCIGLLEPGATGAIAFLHFCNEGDLRKHTLYSFNKDWDPRPRTEVTRPIKAKSRPLGIKIKAN